MTTGLDFVTTALENLGVYAPGEPLESADANRGLDRLNAMLDSWDTESLTCFFELAQSGAVIASKSQYTVGPGGDFDMVRPTRVKFGPGAAILTDGNNNRYPVNVVPQDKWNQIWNLVSVTSNLPNVMFFDPQYPLAQLNLFPMPNIGGMTITWTSYAALSSFPDLDNTDLTFPPGYKLAIELNLAVFMKPFFASAQLDPDVRMQAMEAKGNIKRANVRQNIAQFDPELSRNQGRPYNIYSDTYR